MHRRGEPIRLRAACGASALVLGATILAAGCGSPASNESAAPEVAKAPAAEHAGGEHGGDAAPARVFFVEPKNGATVKSPVKFVFGAEGITIAPVPEGTVTAPRPQIGHHHLGVEQDCMPRIDTVDVSVASKHEVAQRGVALRFVQ